MKPGQVWAQLAHVALADAREVGERAVTYMREPRRAARYLAESERLVSVADAYFRLAARDGFTSRDKWDAFDTGAWRDEPDTAVD